MNKRIYLQHIMNGFIFLLLAGSLAYSIFLSLYFPLNFLQTIGMVFLIYIFLSIFLHSQGVFLFSLSIIIVAIWIYTWFFPKQWWEELSSWLEWIILYIQGIAPLRSNFVLPTAWLLVFIISFIFFVLTIKLKGIFFPFCLGVSIVGVEWFLGHKQISICIWLFTLSIIMLLSSHHYYSLSRISTLPDYGLWLVWTLPMALAVILTSSIFIPQDTSKFKWQFLEDQVNNIQNQWSDRFEFTSPRKPFRLTETGFSPIPGELGGPVKLSDDVVLKVQSSYPLYLRGAVLNEYTGSNWIDSIDDNRYRFSNFYWKKSRDTSFDWDEAIWDELDSAHIDRFFPSINATIYHVSIESSVLFNAIRCYDISPLKKHSYTPYFNEKSETFTSRNVAEEEAYVLNIKMPAMDNPEFKQFIINYVSSSDMEQIYKPSPDLDKDNYPKHQTILEHYTHLPNTVPARVHQLALSITKGLSSPFEKSKALEEYLKKSFTYTLDPPYTPPGRDFADYFLFELKEGYCTYFATAMAVMGRSIGLPTRYVEGFHLPEQPKTQNIYEVRKKHGHAWVEVYFPKVGWLTFDPTPAREIPENEIKNSPFNPNFNNEEQFIDEPIFSPDYTPESDIATSNIENKEKPWLKTLYQLRWFFIVITFFILVAGSVLLWYRWRWYPVKKYPLNVQLRIYYKEILWLFTLYQFPIKPGETPYKYGERVDTWLVNPAATMSEITNILVKTEFGSYPLYIEDLEKVKQFYLYLERDVKNLFGFPQYLVQLIIHHCKKLKGSFVPQ